MNNHDENDLIDQDVSGFQPSDEVLNEPKKGRKKKVLETLLVLLAFVAFCFFAFSLVKRDKKEASVQEEKNSNKIITQTRDINLDQFLPEEEPEAPQEQPIIEPKEFPEVESIIIEVPKDEVSERRRRAGMMIINNNSSSYGANSSTLATVNADSTLFGGEIIDEKRPSVLEEKYTPTVVNKTTATIIDRPELTIAKGTIIPCTLETEIKSDQVGMVTCIVNRDVFSLTGDFPLMQKGTRIIGEYQTGLQRGQARLFVLWTQARTPKNIVVDLNSPATGNLGASGIGGYVDHKFFDRFGAAIMLSMINIGLEIGASEYVAKNSNGADISDTSDYSQALAASVLEKSIDIPPTLNVRQGTNVNVIVARDVDFSTVYRVTR